MNLRCAAVVVLLAAATEPAPAQASINRCVADDGTTIFTDRSCEAFGATAAGTFQPKPGAGGAELPASMTSDGARGGFAIRGCARTPDALVNGVRDALQARDVNRLANYYHWSGTSASAAVGLMDRLERIAARPLAAVELDYPQERPWFDPPSDMTAAADRHDRGRDSSREPAQYYESRDAVPVGAAPGPGYLASLRHGDRPTVEDDVAYPPVAYGGLADARAPMPEPQAMTLADNSAPRGEYSPPPARSSNPRPTGLRVLQASGPDDPGSQSATFGLRRNAGCWWIAF